MNFLDKIDYLMKRQNIKNLNVLSELSGVPYTTLKSFYSKGSDNVKLSTLNKLKSALDCSLDYLVDDEVTDPDFGKTNKSLDSLTIIATDGDDPIPRELNQQESMDIIEEILSLDEEGVEDIKLILQFLKYKKEMGDNGKKN